VNRFDGFRAGQAPVAASCHRPYKLTVWTAIPEKAKS
jgi:hypothetical protein